MENVAIFLAGLAIFALLLFPLVCLVLLIILVRRQNDLRQDIERLTGQLAAERDALDIFRQPVGAPREDVPEPPTDEAESPIPTAPTATAAVSQPSPPIPPPIPSTALSSPALATIQSTPTDKASDPPPPPSQMPEEGLETASKMLVRKLWNGFLFGSDTRPDGVALEHAIASNWLLRIGILIGVLGVGFFLKYSLERNWLDETARCVLSAAAGLVMVVAGIKLAGRKFHLFGLGLIGGGFVVLYWSIYAATVFYRVVPQTWALPMMVVVTVAAGFIAVRLQSPLVAVIGIIGGYGSPILLSMQDTDVVGILLYMLILSGGVLGLSCRRNWHPLNYLGFAFTYGIAFGLQARFAETGFWRVLPFLALYFAIYATAMQINNFLRHRPSTLVELAGQALNSLCFFALAGELIRQTYAKEYVGILTLALTAFFLIHVFLFFNRALKDRPLLVALIALAAFYLTLTMPIVLAANWLTVAWSTQALVMLWAAGKLDSPFLRKLAYILYGVTVFRLFLFDLDREFIPATAPSASGYWQVAGARLVVFLLPVLSLFGAFRLLQKSDSEASVDATGQPSPPSPTGQAMFFWGATLFAFLYFNLELDRMLSALFDPLRPAGSTLLWLALCAYLAYRVARQDSKIAPVFLLLAATGLALKVTLFDLPYWHFNLADFTCGRGTYTRLDATMRSLDFALLIAVFLSIAGLAPPQASGKPPLRTLFGWLGFAVLFLYLTLELNTFLGVFKEGFRSGAISILWSIFAIGLLIVGLKRDQPPLRYLGLALFAIVAGKVFLVDLGKLDPLYRIVAFIVLGALVSGGAFVYLCFRQPTATHEEET